MSSLSTQGFTDHFAFDLHLVFENDQVQITRLSYSPGQCIPDRHWADYCPGMEREAAHVAGWAGRKQLLDALAKEPPGIPGVDDDLWRQFGNAVRSLPHATRIVFSHTSNLGTLTLDLDVDVYDRAGITFFGYRGMMKTPGPESFRDTIEEIAKQLLRFVGDFALTLAILQAARKGEYSDWQLDMASMWVHQRWTEQKLGVTFTQDERRAFRYLTDEERAQPDLLDVLRAKVARRSKTVTSFTVSETPGVGTGNVAALQKLVLPEKSE